MGCGLWGSVLAWGVPALRRHSAPPRGVEHRWASLFRGKEHGMKRLILLLVTMSATMVAMAVPVFAGGGDDDEDNDNESASGGATRNGQIAFRRNLDVDVKQENDVLF